MSEVVQAISMGAPQSQLLILVLGTGAYLMIRLRLIQFRQFGRAFRDLLHKADDAQEGDISPFAALMTAVGGIVGNGNLAGVATAITAGGPGALRLGPAGPRAGPAGFRSPLDAARGPHPHGFTGWFTSTATSPPLNLLSLICSTSMVWTLAIPAASTVPAV